MTSKFPTPRTHVEMALEKWQLFILHFFLAHTTGAGPTEHDHNKVSPRMESESEHVVSDAEIITINEKESSKDTGLRKVQSEKRKYFLSNVHERASPGIQKLLGINEVFEDFCEFTRDFEAEYWGSFFLNFFGISAGIVWPINQDRAAAPANDIIMTPEILTISLAFGLAYGLMHHVFGNCSGGHFNPAVTFGMVVAGECGLIKAVFYFIFQTFGGFMGAGAAGTICSEKAYEFGIIRSLSTSYPEPWKAMVCEMNITMMFLFVYSSVVDTHKPSAGPKPIILGMAVTLAHIIAIPISGASMNPGRSLGPLIGAKLVDYGKMPPDAKKVIDRALDEYWVYFVGPYLGAFMAAGIYRMRFRGDKVKAKQKLLQQEQQQESAVVETQSISAA